MDGKLLDLSLHRMDKARGDLESSKTLFDISKFAQSINRSYYAMFHAARAILALDKFDSKTHSGVISFFIHNYTKTGKFDDRYGKMLKNAEKIRINSDYVDFYIADKETAQLQLNNAECFLEMVEKFLDEKRREDLLS
jgi:uncharacterized protein (UPF0332 family)